MSIEDIPLMYTSDGNVPCDSLIEELEWIVNADYVQLKLRYYRKSDGVLVKESGHVHSLHGFAGKGSAAAFA